MAKDSKKMSKGKELIVKYRYAYAIVVLVILLYAIFFRDLNTYEKILAVLMYYLGVQPIFVIAKKN